MIGKGLLAVALIGLAGGASPLWAACTNGGGYPWANGDCLYAEDLNSAISATNPLLNQTTQAGKFVSGFNGGVPLLTSAQVPNNVALQALTGIIGMRVARLGFTTAGDGGGAVYDWVAGACSPAADNGARVTATGGCWVADFSGTMPTPKVWGAKGDGVTNDSAAVQAALTARAGATVWQGPYSYYIGSALTIPISTTFKGATSKIAMVGISNTNNIIYSNYPALRLSSAAYISMLSSGTIDGVMIYRSGMVFPATATTDPAATFAGTAIYANGDNITLRNGIVMGFIQAFWSNNFHRGTIADMAFDNQANIHIDNSLDTWQISHIHAWPFAVDWAGMTLAQINRTGTNFYLGNSNEHTMISHAFQFGYKRGFVFDNVQAATCTDCDSDGVTSIGDGDHRGFEINGTSYGNVTLIGPRAYAQNYGFYRNDTGGPGQTVKIIGASFNSNLNAIFLDNTTGTTMLYNSELLTNYTPILLNNTLSVLDMDGNAILNNNGPYLINSSAPTDNVVIGPMNRFGYYGDTAINAVASSNVVIHTLSGSAGKITLPRFGNYFVVSASGTITDIVGGWAGRQVTLAFATGTTLKSVAGASLTQMVLKGNVDYTPPSSSTITFAYPGNSAWIETARQ